MRARRGSAAAAGVRGVLHLELHAPPVLPIVGLEPPGDVPGLAAAIGATLDLPAPDREALGWRARAAVLGGFTTASMQAATLDVYREVLAGGALR